jgi:hypothetical protein
MAKKKKSSQLVGWIIAGLLGVVAYQSGILDSIGRITAPAQLPTTPSRVREPDSASEPLNKPHYVNVASLNVRHTPSASGPLITALPRGTPMKVLTGKMAGFSLTSAQCSRAGSPSGSRRSRCLGKLTCCRLRLW